MPPSPNYIPMLIAQTGPVAGQNWVLAQDTLIIGREPECEIVIPDRQVSRQHARLVRTGGTFTIEDLGSKNGTHVNGAALEGPKSLQDGDLIQIALIARLQFVGSEATMPVKLDAAAQPTGPLILPRSQNGRLRMEVGTRRIWVNEQELDPPLSAPQFRFLELLHQRAGQVCTRDEVIGVVWPGAEDVGVSEQAIDALVRRVRDRLAELDTHHHYIITVRGHGFRLDNPEK
jgi:FHA domain-containing protein